jgi:hypothetical protein
MNANELADELEKFSELGGDVFFGVCADMIRRLQVQNEMLKDFVKPILVHGGDGVGDWDGFEIQELAAKTGLFVEKIMTEPCNFGKEETEGCLCRDYCYDEESWTCYRITKFLLED